VKRREPTKWIGDIRQLSDTAMVRGSDQQSCKYLRIFSRTLIFQQVSLSWVLKVALQTDLYEFVGGPVVSKDTDAAREQDRCVSQSKTLGVQRAQEIQEWRPNSPSADVEPMTHIKIQITLHWVQCMQKFVS
jgi:hypothetical protein